MSSLPRLGFRSRSGRFSPLAGLLCLALWIPRLWGADDAGAVEPTKLPAVVVEGAPVFSAPQSWLHGEIPGFEILSSASERATGRFLRDFQLLRSAVDVCLPGANQAAAGSSAELILCGKGRGLEDFVPEQKAEDDTFLSGIFLQKDERVVIVADLRSGERTFDAGSNVENDAYQAFNEEYFRFLLRRGLGAKPPPWLEQGLISLLSSIEISGNVVTIGKLTEGVRVEESPVDPEQTTTIISSNDFVRILGKSAIQPFDRFFSSSPPTGAAGVVWRAQAYAFTHMCLYGEGKRYQSAFLTFARRACRETVTESLFKECFGRGYKDMAIALRGYLEFTMHQYVQIQARHGQTLPEPASVTFREATDSESGRMTGTAFLLAGKTDRARDALFGPYSRGARDARLIAALGLFELERGDSARARTFLEDALRKNGKDMSACLALARLRFAEALEKMPELSPEQERNALEPLLAASKAAPPSAEGLMLAAEIVGAGGNAPTEDAMKLLLGGVQLHPRNLRLVYACAAVCRKFGHEKEADALSEWGEKQAQTPESRALFAKLRTGAAPAASASKSP